MAEDKNLEQTVDDAAKAVMVQYSQLDDLTGKGAAADPIGLSNLMGVAVKVTVEVGRTRLTLGELCKLGPGSLVVLDRGAHESADILVNGKVVARGEVVTVDGSYGVRVVGIVQGS
jgi:flagellar motor switch protein FliN/FliY